MHCGIAHAPWGINACGNPSQLSVQGPLIDDIGSIPSHLVTPIWILRIGFLN